MVDILSGVITGGNHGGKVKDPFDDFTGPQNVGHLFFVMKTNLFINDYRKRIKENILRVKNLPKLKGVKDILYPGESKYLRHKSNNNKKIKISTIVENDIKKLLI
jgi:LDH2 family malate/lactate/ureidoglycolate dehydrogenase